MPASEVDTRIQDSDLPAAGLLLGPSASDVVNQALGQEGGRVQSLSPEYASYRPGRRMLVSYQAEVEWGSAVTEETIVALARNGSLPDGCVHLEAADTPVAVWRFPDDPYVPGLAKATDPGFVRALLDELGAPAGPVELSRRGYWPRTRAVIGVTTAESRMKVVFRPGQGLVKAPGIPLVFLKVVQPEEAEQIYRAHSHLSGPLPVAGCYRWLEEWGILVLEARPGRPLYDLVLEDDRPFPEAGDLLALLGGLADTGFDGEHQETSTATARRYAGVLKALLPAQVGRIDSLLERLGEDSDEPLITAHGDFHEYQLLVEGKQVTALLDVDDVGPGHRIDDLAMMAARFWSFAPFEGQGGRLERYTLHLLERFGRVVDPAELHRRVAAVLFARGTSPFRNQEPGWPATTVQFIQMAEDWLDRPVTRPVG